MAVWDFPAQVPVAEGSHVTLNGTPKTWVADFVHGSDGFGNMNFPAVQVIPLMMSTVLCGRLKLLNHDSKIQGLAL